MKTLKTNLTIYLKTTGDLTEGLFFNPKSNRIYGILQGRYRDGALNGHWIQAKSQKKCPDEKFGTFYWGRFNFVFDKDSFAGSGATAIVLCMTYGVGLKDTDYANKIARLFYPPFTTKEL